MINKTLETVRANVENVIHVLFFLAKPIHQIQVQYTHYFRYEKNKI